MIMAFLCATFIASPVFARPYLREYCHNINGRFLEDSHVRNFAIFVTESTLNIMTSSAGDPFFINTKDPNFDSIYSTVRTAELVGTTIDFCYLPQDHSIVGMSLNRLS